MGALIGRWNIGRRGWVGMGEIGEFIRVKDIADGGDLIIDDGEVQSGDL